MLLHASHNAIIQGYLDPLTVDRGQTRYFTGEFGCAMLPLVILCAWMAWKGSGKVEPGQTILSTPPVLSIEAMGRLRKFVLSVHPF